MRAEGQIFQVRPGDRVFQGFSIAFDASVEEIWLAFFAGAALVVGTRGNGAGRGGACADAGRGGRDGALVRAHAAFHDGGGGGAGAAADPGRRSLPAGSCQAMVETGTAGLQHLRADGGHGHRHFRRMPAGQTGHAGTASAELFRAHPGRATAAGGGRDGGGIVPGRRRAGPRLRWDGPELTAGKIY